MNWVDLIFLGIFCFSAFAGLIRGLVGEVISLIILAASVIIATKLASPVAGMIVSSPTIQGWMASAAEKGGIDPENAASYMAIGVGFIVIFILVSMVGIIVRGFFSSFIQAGMLGFGNRLLGGAFGVLRGFIINLLIIFIVQFTPYSESLAWQESQLVNRYQPAVTWLGEIISPTIKLVKEKIVNTGAIIPGITG